MTMPSPGPAPRWFPIWVRAVVVVILLVVAASAAGLLAGNRGRPTSSPQGVAGRSQLIDLTLPAGSKLIGSTHTGEWDASEFWEMALPFDQEVASIRRQLPVGGELQGLKWCLEEVNNNVGYVHWKWGDPATERVIVVDVFRLFSPLQKNGGVNIHKTANTPDPCSAA
jgi:hypothetical protein